uniref:Hydrolase n=1 Tax=Rhizophora mucronata TaxID=61149 RepID=A0A2P2MCW6_RHIMU
MDGNQYGYATFAEGSERSYPNAHRVGGRWYVSAGEMGFQDQVREFSMGAAELSVQFARGCRDIVVQTLGREDSFLVRNFGKDSYIGKRVGHACDRIYGNLKVLKEYLPEDKDPVHVLSVVCCVFVLAFAALSINTERDESAPLVKKVLIHPPSADRILLPDGRYMAYREQGLPADSARFSMIAPHAFLSSRLAGIPGVKASLLEEFGIQLVTYDLPGFGESDPHPSRNLESSASDMSFLANSLGIKDKFWVVGYSSGSLHAWAALRFIPNKLAGAAIFAPMVNPYDLLMTKGERRGIWEKWTPKRKFMYFFARRCPRFLGYLYRKSFLSGKHEQIDTWLSLSLAQRDKALIEDPIHEEFWQRDVEESIRQGSVKPFIEEAVLQVSNWGFSLADIKLQKKKQGKGFFSRIKTLLSGVQEEYTGFFGPIHIWQGMDDRVVPPLMTDFVHRVLPGAAVHKLPYEGHFTYLYFCDECHKQIFTTLFGTPQGPLNNTIGVDQIAHEDTAQEQRADQPAFEVDIEEVEGKLT